VVTCPSKRTLLNTTSHNTTQDSSSFHIHFLLHLFSIQLILLIVFYSSISHSLSLFQMFQHC
jgi:hypothetical protein